MNLSIRELNELIYSLGITAHHGMLVNKELNESLLEKLYGELNNKLAEEAIDEEIEVTSHFVSNEEADEDAKSNDRFNGVSQFILDFVEANGEVTFTEMSDMYKAYTKGSNSFSHILKALRIPYKNRPTRRYLKKMVNGAYTIGIATPQNWVVKNDYDYRTFNEAPYGDE